METTLRSGASLGKFVAATLLFGAFISFSI
jgi:hypothetical protein